jgi:hypothetical protein
MVKKINLNLDALESLLYFWQATNDREKVSEQYLNEIASMPGFTSIYDSEFNEESVRKILSSIVNREPVSKDNKKEGRFWNNNMWMTEDLGFTDSMVQPVKKINLDSLVDRLKDVEGSSKYEELEVIFSPLHIEDYLIRDNKLVINFFKVKPEESGASVNGTELKEYIEEKLGELLQ